VAPHLQDCTLSFLRSKRGAAVLVVVVLLALFVFRPGADRLRTRIAASIGMALGRPVEVASVSLRFLPQPGFDLQNFVVHEDPAFGAEPTLRAESVTATLRLTSLLRGRLEIARLSLANPSLNLVQNSTGHWNLENLVERSARTPVAPTPKGKTESRPGFPYIEASSGRINFKFGREKKPYALTEADFSVWQGSENSWGMRLKAHPMRTDFNLSDTGVMSIDGSWQRAPSLRVTPLQFRFSWERSQLGQATTLIYGSDRGWRGTITISAMLEGTPADLSVNSNLAVDGFRRYDLADNNPLRLAAQCQTHYSSVDRVLSDLSCHAPVASGLLTVDGSLTLKSGFPQYDLSLHSQEIPMQSVVALARHTKKDIPEDLVATGKLQAKFKLAKEYDSGGSKRNWSGAGEVQEFGLKSDFIKADLSLGRIPFSLSIESPAPNGKRHPKASLAPIPVGPRLDIGPINVALGGKAPAIVRGLFSESEYELSLQGETDLPRLLRLARTVGLAAPQVASSGTATVDLQVGGAWSAFASTHALGKAQLHSVRAKIPGINDTLEIASATLALAPEEIRVDNVSASLADSKWRGSLSLPRQCEAPPCPIHFDLRADTVSTDEWSDLLHSDSRDRPWYRLLEKSRQGNGYLLALRAAGRLAVNRVLLHNLAATHVSANVALHDGVLALSDVEGEILGGTHTGDWTADFTGKAPVYSASGTLQRVALEQLGQSMHDAWITGTGSASYHLTVSGSGLPALTASARASIEFELLDGTLPHLILGAGAGVLRMRRFDGHVILRDSNFQIEKSKLAVDGGIYQVSGTATLGRVLNLKLLREGTRGYSITGSLATPRVTETPVPETQAKLKP
jgi:hypothetical protein